MRRRFDLQVAVRVGLHIGHPARDCCLRLYLRNDLLHGCSRRLCRSKHAACGRRPESASTCRRSPKACRGTEACGCAEAARRFCAESSSCWCAKGTACSSASKRTSTRRRTETRCSRRTESASCARSECPTRACSKTCRGTEACRWFRCCTKSSKTSPSGTSSQAKDHICAQHRHDEGRGWWRVERQVDNSREERRQR